MIINIILSNYYSCIILHTAHVQHRFSRYCLSVERLLHLRAPRWSNKVNSLRYGCLFVRWKSHRDNRTCRIVFKQGALLGYVLPVLVFSTFYNFPKFFEFTTIYPQNGWWQDNDLACIVRQKVTQWIHKIDGWWTFYLRSSWSAPGCQKLAAFRRGQKWP